MAAFPAAQKLWLSSRRFAPRDGNGPKFLAHKPTQRASAVRIDARENAGLVCRFKMRKGLALQVIGYALFSLRVTDCGENLGQGLPFAGLSQGQCFSTFEIRLDDFTEFGPMLDLSGDRPTHRASNLPRIQDQLVRQLH